jgi:hypothetical protein
LKNLKDDLERRYSISCLEGEIYLWQLYILNHPDEDVECYKNAIAENLNLLAELKGD